MAALTALETEVLVIGGGSTGVGVARDAAMRGLGTVLVERGDLAEGTTGRFHGLLHSGGRYVVRDPGSARECAHENRILRRIAADAIEDTGGLFVTTPWDDPEYADRFAEACVAADVPVEELSVAEALRREPRLNPRISRAFTVADASVDAWKLVWANARSAEAHGGRVLPYHRVVDLVREDGAVRGARVRDELGGDELEIRAQVVVNASGAWAGQIAALAGCEVAVLPGRGIMIAMNHRLVNTVVNRCEPPSDGDILVPIRTVCVIGTTDSKVPDPDALDVPADEVEQMLDDGERLVPGFRQARALRVWAGARPLFQETKPDAVTDTRLVSRSHTLLDHRARDGVDGFFTITGGKATTYRLMAEVTVDAVCERLGVERACRTHEEPLPGSEDGRPYRLGVRLAAREPVPRAEQIVCECELITRARLEETFDRRGTANLDDIRRAVRLGMGPCQGGFCIYRATGILHGRDGIDAAAANESLLSFLRERWKGVHPVLYGDQLRQARLDDWIFQGLLNVGETGFPPRAPSFARALSPPQAASRPAKPGSGGESHRVSSPRSATRTGRIVDVVVVGAGLAGLTAAVRLAEAGRAVTVVARGIGATHLSPPVIDILGYADGNVVERPLDTLDGLPGDHPYARIGRDAVREAVRWLSGDGYAGSADENMLLPTAVGARKPSALVPETMAAGDLRPGGRFLFVGFRSLKDFYPALLADNLRRDGVEARAVELDVLDEPDVNAAGLSRRLEDGGMRARVAADLASRLAPGERVGLPAVLTPETCRQLADWLGAPVFEVPTLPPSVGGMRLYDALVARLRAAGGTLLVGGPVAGHEGADGRLDAVLVRAAARPVRLRAGSFVLASGGFASGGLELDSDGVVHETVLGLPVTGVPDERPRFDPDLFAEQPLARAGVAVDDGLRPVVPGGEPVYENVHAAGAVLAGAEPWREASGNGIALASGYAAASAILAGAP